MAPEVARSVTIWAASRKRQRRSGCVAVDHAGIGGRQGATCTPGAKARSGRRQRPRAGDEPVTAAEAAAQPGKAARVGARSCSCARRPPAGHDQGGARRHLPGRLPLKVSRPTSASPGARPGPGRSSVRQTRILRCSVRDNCGPESYDRILFASDADPTAATSTPASSRCSWTSTGRWSEAGMVYVTLPPLFVVRTALSNGSTTGTKSTRRRGGQMKSHLETQGGGAAQQGSR